MATPPPDRSKAILLSNVLFGLVIVLAGVVAYLYFFDNRFFNESPPPPACPEGHNELICVVDTMRETGLKNVELGRYTASANQLTPPGQVIEVDDINAFLFIYTSPTGDPAEAIAAREAEGQAIDPDSLVITSRVAERPLSEEGELHIFQRSNVILIVVGGSPDQLEKVQLAIESLP